MSAGTLLLPPSPPSPPSPPAPPTSGSGGPEPRRFTVDEYHRLIEAGVLTEDDSVELLEGLVVHKVARNPPHDVALSKTDRLLRAALPADWWARVQMAISTADSEPEPDIVVVSGVEDDYLAAHPTAAQIAFVVEVADSSLDVDRAMKARIYAGAGISIYWIVSIPDRQIEVLTAPSGPAAAPGYATTRVYREGDSVPVVIRGQEVGTLRVADCLPRV
jgi:Uma2 family endonuclease